MWIFRGLRDGVVTTRWPRRADRYAEGSRGPAAVTGPATGDTAGLAALCPTGAIEVTDRVTLDQGRCIQCGACVAARPDVFGWQLGPASARLDRPALVVPGGEHGAPLPEVRDELRRRVAALGRSVHLRHVDAGSDGTEEWEILALFNPVYDVHRLGVYLTASPRHADVLMVTGAGAHGMAEPLRRTLEGTPDPKIVIAVGSDAVGGGLLRGSYAAESGIGAFVPVDVWVPGSPPSPFQILYALLLGIGRLPAAVGERGVRS